MKIEKTAKQTPYGPPSGRPATGSGSAPSDDYARFVWEELAPRLVHPSKLAIIRALLESGEHLTLGALAGAANIDEQLAGCHCRRMRSEERRVGKECRYRWSRSD